MKQFIEEFTSQAENGLPTPPGEDPIAFCLTELQKLGNHLVTLVGKRDPMDPDTTAHVRTDLAGVKLAEALDLIVNAGSRMGFTFEQLAIMRAIDMETRFPERGYDSDKLSGLIDDDLPF